MPKIRMITTACGPEGSFQSGVEYEVGAELAAEFLNASPPAAELVVQRPELADAPAVEDADASSGADEDASAPEADLADWPLKTSPADYLKKTPNGPKAVLAKRILEG